VTAHPMCSLSHSLLLAGRCGFCGQAIMRSNVVFQGNEPQWDTPRVLAALAGDFSTSMAVMHILAFNEGDLFAELPIFRAVLGHQDQRLHQFAEIGLSRRGDKLQADGAERCENFLRAHPEEFALRLVLLNYYFLRSSHFAEARSARQAHSLWVIEHRPASQIAGMPYCMLDPKEREVYQKARALWLRHIEAPNTTVEVLGNAANFFTLSEPHLTEQCYLRAKQLEPDNPKWPLQLGHLYILANVRRRGEDRRSNAARGLEQFEEAYRLNRDGIGWWVSLIRLAKAAFDAGELNRAREAAEQLLGAMAQERRAADIAHTGHTLLGRLALREGNINEARTCLLEAANAIVKHEGFSPPGPRELWLARELLEQGARDVVVEYLRRCSGVWTDPDHSAEVWSAAIERGEMPNFVHYLE
jgi:tetratricopeptide (TPR) repeat protein